MAQIEHVCGESIPELQIPFVEYQVCRVFISCTDASECLAEPTSPS